MARSLRLAVGSACVGSGTCRRLMPAVSGADAQGRSGVPADPVEDGDEIREVLESCPVEAIPTRDAATRETEFR